MIVKTPARMAVVKKEEKEQRLVAFLESVLPTTPPGSELCLLVQSASSPAAKAIGRLSTRLTANLISLRVIMARTDLLLPLPGVTYRQLADVRCYDAHELLVVGSRSAWIGDSMRRNPATTDSFELHVADCAETTTTIALSFDRLWNIAMPFTVPAIGDQGNLALAGELAGMGGEQGSTITAMTRH